MKVIHLAVAAALAACSSDHGSKSGTAAPGSIVFAASGEALALGGYAFPPANPGDPAFVDGWQLEFSHLLVTLDHLTLSNTPDVSAGDQSLTGGVVAGLDGPWAVDLSRSDASNLPGKGGPGEQAVPFATLTEQNRNGGAPFATDGTRYAFGFDTVTASASARNVNLDADALASYQNMVQNGCVVTYLGTATFRGGSVAGHEDCNSDAEHASWPSSVRFELCFKSPTGYRNCQNPDNAGATPLGGDEFQRGIAPLPNQAVIAQVTLHTDHPFWDSVLHDSPAHFDQFAARVSDQSGTPTVTLEMTQGVDYTAMTDAAGNPLDWRYCIDPPTDVHPQFNGQMAFDPGSVPHAPGADAAQGLRDYYDFTTYDQSTQGHLNSDGLCFVKRNYPSPS